MTMEGMDPIPNASWDSKSPILEESKILNVLMAKILKDKRCESLAFVPWQTMNVMSGTSTKLVSAYFQVQETKWSMTNNFNNKKKKTVISMASSMSLKVTERYLVTCVTEESKWTQSKSHAQVLHGSLLF